MNCVNHVKQQNYSIWHVRESYYIVQNCQKTFESTQYHNTYMMLMSSSATTNQFLPDQNVTVYRSGSNESDKVYQMRQVTTHAAHMHQTEYRSWTKKLFVQAK